ncbi:CsbD family protein, partial [Streptomyces sp. NPDC051130]
AAGRAVGNERLTAEGRAEQAKGDARQAKEFVFLFTIRKFIYFILYVV